MNNLEASMLPLNPWDNYAPMKTLYSKCMEPICEQYQLTRTELDILLFLANNPKYDTAAAIVEVRYLVKSQVSTSIKHLEEKGFLTKQYHTDNRKTIHLSICEAAKPLITDGRHAQENFFSILCDGFTEEEMQLLQDFFFRTLNNINNYLKEKK